MGLLVVSFVAMFALDCAFVRYTRAIVERRSMAASSYAALITLCNSAVVLSFVADPWAVLSTAAGAFCGTYVMGRMK